MRYPETAALIKQARLKKKLSQQRAAELVGCSRLQFINWEQGAHRPEKYATALVEVIGVDKEKLRLADDGGLDQDALYTPLARAVQNIVDAQVEERTRLLEERFAARFALLEKTA